MTDRELLEFAAKAAGVKAYWSDNLEDWQKDLIDPYVNKKKWNPLTDSGDVLELAVKLRSYGIIISLAALVQVEILALHCDSPYEELDTTDPVAATRLAIVRAAAEIGKQMP